MRGVRFSPRRIPLHGYAVRTGVKRFLVIWDAACRVKLGRIGPCRRRRWEPFRTPCACTGVMLFIHRVSDGSMLFPTELGGGNDSRIVAHVATIYATWRATARV